jgi:hypothetical protein
MSQRRDILDQPHGQIEDLKRTKRILKTEKVRHMIGLGQTNFVHTVI